MSIATLTCNYFCKEAYEESLSIFKLHRPNNFYEHSYFQSQSFENFINFIKYLVLVVNQCWLAGQWLEEMNAEP